MDFSGSGIEFKRDGIELFLVKDSQVAAFGQILTQQPVGVFIAAALPRAVGIGKVNLHAGSLG